MNLINLVDLFYSGCEEFIHKINIYKELTVNHELKTTSAMDAGGCERLIRYLDSIKHDKIIIMVSHDQKLMEAADKVITLCKAAEAMN